MRDKEKVRERHRLYHQEHREEILKRMREVHRKHKEDVIRYYGNGDIVCVECGFNDIRALTIDHIDGNGINHRKMIGNSKLYRWLKQNNYPSGFQTLCMNCQYLKRVKHKEYESKNKKRLL